MGAKLAYSPVFTYRGKIHEYYFCIVQGSSFGQDDGDGKK